MARIKMAKTISVMLTEELDTLVKEICAERNENYSPIFRELIGLGVQTYRKSHPKARPVPATAAAS